jgi:hypothetical protein
MLVCPQVFYLARSRCTNARYKKSAILAGARSGLLRRSYVLEAPWLRILERGIGK